MEVIQAHSSELEGRLKKHFTTSEVILRHPFHNRKRNNFRVGTTELPTEDTAARLFKVPGFDTMRVKQKLIGHKSRDRGDSAASPIEEFWDLIELRVANWGTLAKIVPMPRNRVKEMQLVGSN